MLKIRPGIDLRELERFGFAKNEISTYEFKRYIDNKLVYRVFITEENRHVNLEIYSSARIVGSLQTLLYDLIQSGITKKIEIVGE